MLTNQQALQELANEDMQSWLAGLEGMMTAIEGKEQQQQQNDEGNNNNNNREVLQQWRNNLLPTQVINEIDVAIADYLKRVRKADPDFALLKFDFLGDNPAEFDRLKKELQDKGLF